MSAFYHGNVGTGGNGIQLSVKLDSSKPWDIWVRDVHGFAAREGVLENLICPAGNTRVDWYRPVKPTPINEEEEHARLLSIENDRQFQLARDRLNRRMTEYFRHLDKYERQVQVLADLTFAMKRSAGETHQGTLNNFTEGFQVYDYLERAYAPSQEERIQDVIKRIDLLEKADFASRGIEQWLQSWKDVSRNLLDMGMPAEADRLLRLKFQMANQGIKPETETFLKPKLYNDSTLQDMIDNCLTFYRYYPPPQPAQAFASSEGKRQEGSTKTYQCFCGENHVFEDCPYLNPHKRAAGWRGNLKVQREFRAALDDNNDKRGNAIRKALQRLGKSWDDVQVKDESQYQCFCGENHAFADCPYVNPAKRPAGWRGNLVVQRKFQAALDDSDNRKGVKIKGVLERLGKSWEDVQIKEEPQYQCFCGENHTFGDCPYVNPNRRPAGWRGNLVVQRKFRAVLDNTKNKKGAAIRGVLERLGNSWEDVQLKDEFQDCWRGE